MVTCAGQVNEIDNFSTNVRMCIFERRVASLFEDHAFSVSERRHQVFELSNMHLVYRTDNLLGCINRAEDAL